MLRNGNEIATAASLQREREMIECIDPGIGASERLGGSNQFVISDRFTREQKHVVYVSGEGMQKELFTSRLPAAEKA